MASMITKLTIDKTGRIVLPKAVRDHLRLLPGDALVLDSNSEKITLRPVRKNAPLRKKRGVWVFSAGEPLSAFVVHATEEQIRSERVDRTGIARKPH
jgi:AbrB family looped-hinge helix DNA binding protein